MTTKELQEICEIVRLEAGLIELQRCVQAIIDCPGLTDDEKRIAIRAIDPSD